MDDDDGINGGRTFIRITNEVIWDEMKSMNNRLSNIEQTIKPLVVGQGDHESRMRALELKFYGLVAGITGVLIYTVVILIKAAAKL